MLFLNIGSNNFFRIILSIIRIMFLLLMQLEVTITLISRQTRLRYFLKIDKMISMNLKIVVVWLCANCCCSEHHWDCQHGEDKRNCQITDGNRSTKAETDDISWALIEQELQPPWLSGHKDYARAIVISLPLNGISSKQLPKDDDPSAD